VSWNTATGRWKADVTVSGKQHHIGYFDDLDDAAAVVAAFYTANGFSDGHGQEHAKYASAAL